MRRFNIKILTGLIILFIAQCTPIPSTDIYTNRDRYETGPFEIFGIIGAILAIIWIGAHVVSFLSISLKGSSHRREEKRIIEQQRIAREKVIEKQNWEKKQETLKKSNARFDLDDDIIEQYWTQRWKIQLEFNPETNMTKEDKDRFNYYIEKHKAYFQDKERISKKTDN